MALKQTVFHLTLPSDPKHIGRVEGFLAKVKHSIHLDEIQTHKLMVSLTEAVNNAIMHGNKSQPAKKVSIVCELLPGWLLVMVTDQGKGFRGRKVGNPLLKKNLLLENGRGIFLMKTLMDKVEFTMTRAGLQVSLWLNLNK